MILREYEYKEIESVSMLPDYPRFLLPEGTIVIGYDYYQGWEGDIEMTIKVLMPTFKGPNDYTQKEEKS